MLAWETPPVNVNLPTENGPMILIHLCGIHPCVICYIYRNNTEPEYEPVFDLAAGIPITDGVFENESI